MKVGIVTLYDAPNYGAFLQAYTLQTVIQKLGHEVEFIRIKNASPLGHIYTDPKMLICDLRRKRAISKSISRLNIAQDILEKYDTVILGSDEIWNLDNRSFKHYPIFYGAGINCKNIITYAPSVGNMNYQSMIDSTYAQSALLQIKHLSARDNRTARMVRTLTGMDSTVVLDPTLLLGDFTAIEEPCIRKDYIFVYSYGLSPVQIKAVRELANKKGCYLLSGGIYNKWCDVNLPVSPFEFLDLVRGSYYVITSTFHGMIFSVLYQKQYAVYGMGDKVVDLSERLGLNDRLVYGDNAPDMIDNPIDWEQVSNTLASEREKSYEYLVSALG